MYMTIYRCEEGIRTHSNGRLIGPLGVDESGFAEVIANWQEGCFQGSDRIARLFTHTQCILGQHDRVSRFRSYYFLVYLLAVSIAFCARLRAATSSRDHLAGNTVLIVRHAEKPLLGRELTRTGEARAEAYVHYFEPFHDAGRKLRVNALYAGADSADSVRPRLTLEPLSAATGIPLDSSVSTKDPAALVALLRTHSHGNHPLVAWRHGSIPALLSAFGASPDLVLGGEWPNDVYDWVIVLNFDRSGHIRSERLVKETLTLR